MAERAPYEGSPAAALLASDDWRPLDQYPAGEFVYVRGFSYRAPMPYVAVARRGRHPLAYWYQPPPDGPLALAVNAWQPLPADGVSVYDRAARLYGDPDDGRYVRPPEPVYAPGGVDARLTPQPAAVLRLMHAGLILHERAWRWTEWRLSNYADKLTERPVNALRKVAFIARDGVLPPGRLPGWLEFNWYVTDAGRAWVTANPENV